MDSGIVSELFSECAEQGPEPNVVKETAIVLDYGAQEEVLQSAEKDRRQIHAGNGRFDEHGVDRLEGFCLFEQDTNAGWTVLESLGHPRSIVLNVCCCAL